ncbi:hypothetical protein P9850_01280 [Anoxybacillus rupiensis]|uniref:Uncharacterized protein n=1 Tax=Anoxybacteroides rupiense TaxID=311460 RepID=A0ABD5IQG1_9BACL|nr:hypothetical protein [Anoxybacillus rupiensis]
MVRALTGRILFGTAGFMLVFFLSLPAHTIATTLLRSAVSFIAFFVSGYVFQWMFAYISREPVQSKKKPSHSLDANELQPLMEGLTKEEAQQVAAYIRHMLHDEKDG